MARKYDSEETNENSVIQCPLFIEKGYHETTMTEILHNHRRIRRQFSLHFSHKRWRSCKRTYRIHV